MVKSSAAKAILLAGHHARPAYEVLSRKADSDIVLALFTTGDAGANCGAGGSMRTLSQLYHLHSCGHGILAKGNQGRI
jgi:hypothetical protein